MARVSQALAFPRLCALLARRPTRFSQAMHNAVFKALALDYCYVALDTEETEAAVSAMRALGFRGYSLTIPHKERAVDLVDTLSESARGIGAVNTIVNHGSTLSGFNTDWLGIERALNEAAVDVKGDAVVLLGAGGAARAAIYAAKTLKAASVTIVNRTVERAEKLADEFSVSFAPIESLAKVCKEARLIFNATPLGSHLAGGELDVDFRRTRPDCTAFDMVVGITEFTSKAAEARRRAITGDRMLVYQAIEQSLLFTALDREENFERIKELMEAALKKELGLADR